MGSIPEFVQIKDLIDFYKYLTEANMKNTIIIKQTLQDEDQCNIKDDIALMQFKLIDRKT